MIIQCQLKLHPVPCPTESISTSTLAENVSGGPTGSAVDKQNVSVKFFNNLR